MSEWTSQPDESLTHGTVKVLLYCFLIRVCCEIIRRRSEPKTRSKIRSGGAGTHDHSEDLGTSSVGVENRDHERVLQAVSPKSVHIPGAQ